MKAMNILVISFVMVVGSLFLFNEKAVAASAVAVGDIAIMHTFNTATKSLEILIYHESSNSFLLYGYSSKAKKGLRLLHVRRLEYDFAFAEKTKKELEYKKEGYDMDRIKNLIEGYDIDKIRDLIK